MWTALIIATVFVKFLLRNTVPYILQAIGAIQIERVQLKNAKQENVSIDLNTLHSNWFGQLFHVNLKRIGKEMLL